MTFFSEEKYVLTFLSSMFGSSGLIDLGESGIPCVIFSIYFDKSLFGDLAVLF